MTKINIEEKFNTSMGLVFRVKNDRVFIANEIVDFEEGKYIIKKIIFTSDPNDTDYVNLVVSKAL